MPSRNTIEIVINATDNASRVFNSLGRESQKLGGILTAGIVTGIGAATTAIGGFAVKGLQEFTKFEAGMQEVFSLLPGISQDAMNELTNQVEDISTRFGTLPEKVIPAFYEALSAGIPQDNVFSFVETANKAAIAGVTDLDTAVSGISSVMNAYGHDVLDATKASDIMFMAVKLGKTTFEELSQSLYNVTPTAAALGISFEEVSAQLAAITAAGVPTSVATTQMRDLFNQLSKSGTKTADLFQELAGKSFRDFIKEGHTVQDALKLMEKHAADSGLSISDLFTSVEAANAALNLTGRNSERYTDFLGQMGDAAGATEIAFGTMSKSLQFQINRLNAKFNVLLITVGKKLAPAFARPVEVIGNFISFITDLIDGVTDFTDIAEYDIPKAFLPFMKVLIKVRDGIVDFMDTMGKLKSIFLLAGGDIRTFNYIVQQIFPDSIISKISHFVYVLDALGDSFSKHMQPITEWIKNNVKLQDVLVAIGVAIASFIIPAIVGLVVAITPLIVTFGLLIAGAVALRKAWQKNFLGIRDITKKVTDAIGNFFGDVGDDVFGGLIRRVEEGFKKLRILFSGNNLEIVGTELFREAKELPIIGGLIDQFNTLKDALTPVFHEIGVLFNNIFGDVSLDQVIEIGSTLLSLTSPLGIIKLIFEQITGISLFDLLIEGITKFGELLHNLNEGKPLLEALGIKEDSQIGEIIKGIENFIRGLVDFVVNQAIPGLQQLGNWFLTDVLPKVVDFITTVVIPGVQTFIDILKRIWDDVSPFLFDLADWFLTDILPAIIRYINDYAIPVIEDIIGWLQDIWTAVAPYLEDLYEWFVTTALPGIIDFLNNVVTPVINTFITLLQDIWNLVSPVIDNLVNWFTKDGLPGIIDYIENTFKTPFEAFIGLISGIWEAVRPGIELFKTNLEGAFNWIKTNIIDPIATRIEEFKRTLQSLGLIAADTQSAIAGVSTNPSSAVTNPANLFGAANGMSFVPRDMPVNLHRGERVLTVQENQEYSGNQNQKPSIVIENINFNDISDQNEANEKADMFVKGLRLQGVEI